MMNSSDDDSEIIYDFEEAPIDETIGIKEISETGTRLQDKRADQDASQEGKILRGVHAKSHGCVKAEFSVRNDISEEYQIGLFSRPGEKHAAWIRFSNASVLRENDLKENDNGIRQNGSRGMSIKILDVDGEMLSEDDGRNNQDFLMINTPMFAFANVRDYLRLGRILDRDTLGADTKMYFIPAVLAQLGEPKDGEPTEIADKRKFLKGIAAADPLLNSLTKQDLAGTIASAKVAATIAQQTVRNPMQIQYFGAAPFLFGPNKVMKFSVAPCKPVEQSPFDIITAESPSENYLRDALYSTMNSFTDIEYDFMIQTRDAKSGDLSIEDATSTWTDELSNYVSVAKITIKAPQEMHSAATLSQCEKMAFNPWHALADHQPLGGINRLRKQVYFGSAKHRNACGS